MANGFSRLRLPLKALVERLTVTVLVVASIGFLLIGKADLKLVDLLANGAGDVTAPVLGLIGAPVRAARDVARGIGDSLALAEENARLRTTVERLLAWQAQAIRLNVQNQALREAAGMPPIERAITIATATIVGDTGGGFVQTRLIDAGMRRGVAVGQAVVDAQGLVGRIVAVGSFSARVLLITDLNAKIPVLVAGSGDRAIMEGDNGRHPHLRFLPRNPHFKVGDRLITSGDGGLIPAGIAVGSISRIDGQRVEVGPSVDWPRLAYVRVLSAVPVAPPDLGDDVAADRTTVVPPMRTADGTQRR